MQLLTFAGPHAHLGHRFGARACAELPQARGDVALDRPLREHECAGDVAIAEPLGNEPEALAFTKSSARAGRRPWNGAARVVPAARPRLACG